MRVLDAALAWLADARCAHCAFPVDRGALCAACAVPEVAAGMRCARCDGAVPAPMARCGRCLEGFLAPLDTYRGAGVYAGPFRTLLVRGKTAARRDWIEATESLVAAAARRDAFPVDAVVPVPSHPRRWAARGFNAAEIVARKLAVLRGLPVVPCLVRTKHAAPLSGGASRAARARAVQGAFRAVGPPPPRVCLVDDVLTTGATLSACARILRSAGAGEIHGWTLLRAPDPR